MFNKLNMMIKLKYIHLAFLGLGMRDAKVNWVSGVG